jgi:ribosomal protein S18 acetylase RimI-like enzyme
VTAGAEAARDPDVTHLVTAKGFAIETRSEWRGADRWQQNEYLYAFADGEQVGVIMLGHFRHPRFAPGGEVTILGIRVAPEVRRRGIATTLDLEARRRYGVLHHGLLTEDGARWRRSLAGEGAPRARRATPSRQL